MHEPDKNSDGSTSVLKDDDLPVEPDVDENGVDLTLVRCTLSLTPTERLQALDRFNNLMETVRHRNPISK